MIKEYRDTMEDEEIRDIMERYGLDKEEAERMLDIADEQGIDVDEAFELQDDF